MKEKALFMAGIFVLFILAGCMEKEDRSAPYVKLMVEGNEKNGWYNTNVTIFINATDNESRVKEIKYRIDGDIWKDYVMPVIITKNGEHIFEYYAKDQNGNERKGNLTIKIDKIKPYVAFENFEEGYTYVFGKKKITLRYPRDTVILGKMEIRADARDGISGIEKVEFYAGDDIVFEGEKEPYAWTVSSKIGVYNITVVAYDVAGNVNSITIPDVQIFTLK